MRRDIYSNLVKWKNSSDRKPLLLKGARQVGKTYLLQEFGKKEYKKLAYFDFEEDPNLKELFTGKISPDKILEKLSIASEQKITAKNTLIVFDEVQECPPAITSLKYFYDKAPEYHVIASGSLLGIRLGQDSSFPVGKVNIINLYPFSFYEFLTGIGAKKLRKLVEDKRDFTKLNKKFHIELIEYLKIYFFVGGMPEVIGQYKKDNKNFKKIRNIQKNILTGYETDFGKHSSKSETLKIKKIWETIPKELAKENKKFMLSHVKKNARYRDYEHAIQWLKDSGYIYLSKRIKRPNLPLKAYTEKNIFKLFFLDTGLLGAMLDIPMKIIVEGDKLFNWYKGAFTENYVAQQLVGGGNAFVSSTDESLYYWNSGETAEIDFIIQSGGDIYPLDVKSGKNLKSESLKVYKNRYTPQYLCRTSMLNFSTGNKYFDFPLYAINLFPDIL